MREPSILSPDEARALADQMGVCICGRANQTYCDYGTRTDALAIPACGRGASREEAQSVDQSMAAEPCPCTRFACPRCDAPPSPSSHVPKENHDV